METFLKYVLFLSNILLNKQNKTLWCSYTYIQPDLEVLPNNENPTTNN